jgi:hypothetical protein
MEEDEKKNRIFLISSLVAVLVIAVLLGLFYFDQRKENAALRIKMITQSSSKRIPKTFNQMASELPPPKLPTTPKTTKTSENIPEVPLADMPTEELIAELNMGMSDVEKQSKDQLDKNINVADEILSREPDSYSAYKAKLKLLLAKESKFKEKIDDSEVNLLLERIAEFEAPQEENTEQANALAQASDETAETAATSRTPANVNEEASVPNVASNQRQMLESNIQSVASERVGIQNKMDDFDTYTRQWGELNRKKQELSNREEELNSEIEIYDESVPYAFDTYNKPSTKEFLDEDVVEIPFMRQLAHNEYTQAEQDAETFIEEYPSSISGYFYLIRSLELQGRGGEIPGVINNSQLSQDAQDTLLDRLDQTRDSDPEKYWERLSY